MLSIVAIYFVSDVWSTLAPPVTIYKLTTTPLPLLPVKLPFKLAVCHAWQSENILQATAFQCDI